VSDRSGSGSGWGSARGRYGLALAGGLLLAGAFPRWSYAALGWLAPAVVAASAIGASPGMAFRLGYAAGLAQCLAAFSWLLLIPFPAGAVAGWLALSLYLALYPAAWVWMARVSMPEPLADGDRGADAPLGGGACSSWGWAASSRWAAQCAFYWVALEMVRARLLTGFPWNPLGGSQFEMLSLIQVAAWTGVYGISFLMVWFSMALLRVAAGWTRDARSWRSVVAVLYPPVLVVVAVSAGGFYRIMGFPAGTRPLSMALVQPSLAQSLIWDAKESTNRFHGLLELSRQALAEPADVLVWPEAAVPNVLRYDEGLTLPGVTNLAREHRIWIVLTADDAAPRFAGAGEGEWDFYNSAFLFDPEGQLRAEYRKRHLVAFGEFVPLVRWLPLMRHLTPVQEGFTAGDRPGWFALPPGDIEAAPLICFEDIFGHQVRGHVRPETDLLLNLTNDGWFGHSAAQWQHAVNALFRAVENGRPLVRCTNNGVSCWIDPVGRMNVLAFGEDASVYGRGFGRIDLRLPAAGEQWPATFYNRHGDWFGWGCVAISLLSLGIARFR